MSSARLSLALAAIFAAALAAPAYAVDATAPAPCAGVLSEDPAGDSVMKPGSLIGSSQGQAKGPDNSDVRNVFFNYRPGKDGKPVLTANIQVTNLDKKIPSQQYSTGGLAWYVYYTYKNEWRFLRAHNQTGSSVTYGYGHITQGEASGVFVTDGSMPGAFFEGPNGIVQMDVPEAVGGKVGEELGGVVGSVDGFSGGPDDVSGFNNHFDTAPDEADITPPSGPAYQVTACPSGAPKSAPNAPPATPGPFSSDRPTTGPAAPPASGGGQQGGGGTQTSSPNTPLLTFQRNIGSAKKGKRGKRIRVGVAAAKPVTALKVQLRDRRGKVVARGALSKLTGSTRVWLKFRQNLKAGKYTIVASAKVDGRTQTVRQAVLARK